jgi:surfactin synthase thioesterase subunit/acyl carrier protein
MRREIIIDTLRDHITRELGLEKRVNPKERLDDLGVDSLMSVTLANRIEPLLGIRVPVVQMLKSPTVEELADEITATVCQITPGDPESVEVSATVHQTPAKSRRDRWLVFPAFRPHAAFRLFCFNFAGGGAATYRPWAELLPPSIEVVAIEPPGRAGRIQEKPVTTLEALLSSLIPEILLYTDKPYAFVGHCLGGLNLFETARALIHRGVPPIHLFISGSRPPHRLLALGRFEEDLIRSLLSDTQFDPLQPLHEQPDGTFAKIIGHFNIGATQDFLAHPELRDLLFPAIRADFETVWLYRFRPEPPWNIPITCFIGLDDPYVTRDDGLEWSRYTSNEFRMHFRKADHFLIVNDRNFIVSTIHDTLLGPQGNPTREVAYGE